MTIHTLLERWPWMRGAAIAAAVVVVAAGSWGLWTWWSAEQALERTSLGAVDDRQFEVPGGELAAVGDVLNVLVVGSDSREGLTDEERRRLRTGDFDGAQTDTILLLQVTEDGVSMVSFPRDLKVTVAGETKKINAVLSADGRDRLVGLVEGALGIDIDHYVEVAIPSFLDIVDAAGGVEICLDEPLEDRKSGADFDAGCHDMDGADALSYVRSRAGPRGDFARVERQQTFLRALADRASSLGVLGRPDVLRSVVTEVADGLTVDEGLSVPRMLALANALRGSLDEGVDASTVPAWPSDEGGVAYVIAYPPGVDALADALREAEPLPTPPSAEDRQDLAVGLWTVGGPQQTAIVESVLFFAGFEPAALGAAPEEVTVGRTTVFHVDGAEEEARWLAHLLGASLRAFPDGMEPPDGVDVAIAVDDDATPTTVEGAFAPPA